MFGWKRVDLKRQSLTPIILFAVLDDLFIISSCFAECKGFFQFFLDFLNNRFFPAEKDRCPRLLSFLFSPAASALTKGPAASAGA